MLEKSLTEFTEATASKSPTPGGGGVCAYVGALGVALGNMVGSLTVGKKKYADVEDEIIALNEKSQELMHRLEKLVERDAEVFYPLSQAYSMPKETPEQIEEKERVLQEALVDATMVPLDIVRTSVEALELVAEYAHKGSVLAVSDAGCAAALLKAAIDGGKLNVLINTKLMKDNKLKEDVEKELDSLVEKGTLKSNEIYTLVEKRLR